MAREVVINVLCDLCSLDGERAEALELAPIAIGNGKPKVLALCEVHQKELWLPVVDLYSRVKNPTERPVKAKMAKSESVEEPPHRGGTPKALPDSGECPSCHRSFKFLGGHWRTAHQAEEERSLGQALGMATPHQCPHCPLAFTHRQGLTMHLKVH